MAAARLRKQPLYINQCTADTRPEDLLVTPVLAESGKIAYHASPLVSAMLTGGVCVLDEGNRMNEKSWASLAPLLDHRRYVESVVAGVTIPAHPDFRVCVTMNEDESTYEVPDYILSRLQPTLTLGFPGRDDEMAILKYHLPFAKVELLALTVEFLQQAHALKLDFSPRDGINLLRYRTQADGPGLRSTRSRATPPGARRWSASWATRRPTSRSWPAASAAPWEASTPRWAWATSSSTPATRSIPMPTRMTTTRTTTMTRTRTVDDDDQRRADQPAVRSGSLMRMVLIAALVRRPGPGTGRRVLDAARRCSFRLGSHVPAAVLRSGIWPSTAAEVVVAAAPVSGGGESERVCAAVPAAAAGSAPAPPATGGGRLRRWRPWRSSRPA